MDDKACGAGWWTYFAEAEPNERTDDDGGDYSEPSTGPSASPTLPELGSLTILRKCSSGFS